MKAKKWGLDLLKWLGLVLCMTAITLGIRVGMNGMWLIGMPKAESVTSVTIKYPSITEQALEVTDREQIKRCVHMSGFLKYKPFQKANGRDEPLITFYYHLDNGDQIEVSANSKSVFYRGKKHVLKTEALFVNVVEGLFFAG